MCLMIFFLSPANIAVFLRLPWHFLHYRFFAQCLFTLAIGRRMNITTASTVCTFNYPLKNAWVSNNREARCKKMDLEAVGNERAYLQVLWPILEWLLVMTVWSDCIGFHWVRWIRFGWSNHIQQTDERGQSYGCNRTMGYDRIALLRRREPHFCDWIGK